MILQISFKLAAQETFIIIRVETDFFHDLLMIILWIKMSKDNLFKNVCNIINVITVTLSI